MSDLTPAPMPLDLLRGLRSVLNNNGSFKSMKQRGFLVSKLTEFALSIRTLGELDADGNFAPSAREYSILDTNGDNWAFTCNKTQTATDPCLTLRSLVNFKVPAAPVAAPVALGPVVSEDVREELKALLKWGPSEFVFVAPSDAAISALVNLAGLDVEKVEVDRSRKVDAAWDAASLRHITQVQIAAKGLLCEVGDNAGTSPTSMSPEDANYISEMLTEGHIRNAHWFKRKSMSEKAIRRATVVNGAKMDEATHALALRMVALMNAEVARLGRPVGFGEYVEIMTEAA